MGKTTKLERIHKDLADVIDEKWKQHDKMIPKTQITREMAKVIRRIDNPVTSIFSRKGKRGQVDLLFVFALLFAVAIISVFAIYLWNQFATTASPAFENVTAGSSAPFTALTNIMHNSLDYLYIAIFFSLAIGLIVTSFLTPTHPIFFPISIILLIGLVVASAIMSNAYGTISTTSPISSSTQYLSMTGYIMNNLPIIVTVLGVILMIVLYSRSGNSLGGGIAPTG